MAKRARLDVNYSIAPAATINLNGQTHHHNHHSHHQNRRKMPLVNRIA